MLSLGQEINNCEFVSGNFNLILVLRLNATGFLFVLTLRRHFSVLFLFYVGTNYFVN